MQNNFASALDRQINAIRPGGSLQLGNSNGIRTSVELSGNGKTLRFVRSTAKGFEVFKTVSR